MKKQTDNLKALLSLGMDWQNFSRAERNAQLWNLQNLVVSCWRRRAFRSTVQDVLLNLADTDPENYDEICYYVRDLYPKMWSQLCKDWTAYFQAEAKELD